MHSTPRNGGSNNSCGGAAAAAAALLFRPINENEERDRAEQ